MKFSSQEEYGSRCLVRLAREGVGASLTIPEISQAEGLSVPYVAKLMRILRRSGFVRSVRGQAGGYSLARPAEQIVMGDLLGALGGRLYEPEFCRHHSGIVKNCLNTTNCSIRPVWQTVQIAVDRVLNKMTLKDLLQSEQAMTSWTSNMVKAAEIRGDAPHFAPGIGRGKIATAEPIAGAAKAAPIQANQQPGASGGPSSRASFQERPSSQQSP